MLTLAQIAEIALFSVCCGYCWVILLTTPRGLFAKVTAVYKDLPEIIQKVLTCTFCLSGWIALCGALFSASWEMYITKAASINIFLVLLDSLRCCLLAMMGAKIVHSITER
jgi:hypothetical protein